jgi:hypothetical protein
MVLAARFVPLLILSLAACTGGQSFDDGSDPLAGRGGAGSEGVADPEAPEDGLESESDAQGDSDDSDDIPSLGSPGTEPEAAPATQVDAAVTGPTLLPNSSASDGGAVELLDASLDEGGSGGADAMASATGGAGDATVEPVAAPSDAGDGSALCGAEPCPGLVDCGSCGEQDFCCGGAEYGMCMGADVSTEECSAALCATCDANELCVTHWIASLIGFRCEPNPCDPESPTTGVDDECAECALSLCGAELCRASDSEVQCVRRCNSPDTPIATPDGERPIVSLRDGDLVYSVHEGRVTTVPILALRRLPAKQHEVVRVELENGRVLEISGSHPTADGRQFADLRTGELLGTQRILTSELVPYGHDYTYDILPASDSGTYFAGGALIGSTLFRGSVWVTRDAR